MTVSTDAARVVHVANGSATLFSFAPIEQIDATNVRVTTVASGVETVRTLGVDYFLEPGGVRFDAAPANGVRVIIQRVVPLLQPDNYITNAPFPAEVTEGRFDDVVMALQQMSDALSRTLKVSVGDLAPPADLPANRANLLLGFDGGGQPVAVPGSSIGNVLISAFTLTLLNLASSAAWRSALGVTDATAFGLGNVDAPLPPSNDFNLATASGFYRASTTTLNRPADDVAVVTIRASATRRTQIACTTNAAAPGRTLWFRSQHADASWSPWTEMASRAYVDGAVGSAAVLPAFLLMNEGVV